MSKYCLLVFICTLSFASTLHAQNEVRANIEVRAVTKYQETDGDGKVITKTESEYHYNTSQTLSLNKAAFENYRRNPQLCTGEGMCAVFTGTSRQTTPAGATNNPVDFTMTSKTWKICNSENPELTYQTEGHGSLTDYNINSTASILLNQQIKDENDQVFKEILEHLTKGNRDEPAMISLVGDHSVFLYVKIGGLSPNINQAAPKAENKTYDCETKKWTEVADKYGLTIPDFQVIKQHNKSSKEENNFTIYRLSPLNENDLISLLKDPTKQVILTAKGFSFEQNRPNGDKSGTESQTEVFVTLKIN